MRARAAVFGCFFIALLAAGGASTQPKQDLTPVKFSVGLAPSGYPAYIFAASEKGYFRDEGLDVSFIVPSSAADFAKVIAFGGAQFGTGSQDDQTRRHGLGEINSNLVYEQAEALFVQAASFC